MDVNLTISNTLARARVDEWGDLTIGKVTLYTDEASKLAFELIMHGFPHQTNLSRDEKIKFTMAIKKLAKTLQ